MAEYINPGVSVVDVGGIITITTTSGSFVLTRGNAVCDREDECCPKCTLEQLFSGKFLGEKENDRLSDTNTYSFAV